MGLQIVELVTKRHLPILHDQSDSIKKNSAQTIVLSDTKLLNLSLSVKLVNFLNCENVLNLQPCLSQGT